MKINPTLLFLPGLMISISTSAQQIRMDLKPAPLDHVQQTTNYVSKKSKTSQAVIWSEDFSAGIPAGWQNIGYNGLLGSDPAALWEYRGPSTTPNNSTGSRGQWATGIGTITSPTTSNGFMIFDSDYLDNGGTANPGTGLSPAPHLGTLVTDTIDLSAHNRIEIRFNSYARSFFAEFKLALSSDGGQSFPDTIEFHDDLPNNIASARDDILSADISSYVGGSALAVLSFIFDGRPGNANGNGYYYWMIDDIEIADLPKHELRFTDAGGAPAHDIIFDGNSPGSKQGHMENANKTGVSFDSNILNYGSQTQTGVTLTVDIYGSNGFVRSVSSSPPVTIKYGETATFDSLFTPQWVPSAIDDYTFVYTLSSDSIPLTAAPRDSFNLFVTDSTTSLDFGTFDNTVGTGVNLGDDGARIASRLYFPNGARVSSVTLGIASATVAGGEIEIGIYDTTGFRLASGYGAAPKASKIFTIAANQAGANRLVTFDMKGVTTIDLAPGAYYFDITMNSNGGQNPIRIANDGSFPQPSSGALGWFASLMYVSTANSWFAGFQNSDAFESPFIRVNTDFDFSIDEDAIDFELYPNPSSGLVNLKISERGIYQVVLTDMLGKSLYDEQIDTFDRSAHQIDLSHFAKGVYLITISDGNNTGSVKMAIR